MSFNRQVKHELVRRREIAGCCCSWELTALVLLRGYLTLRGGNQILSIMVDYNALARYVFRLLKKRAWRSLWWTRNRRAALARIAISSR